MALLMPVFGTPSSRIPPPRARCRLLAATAPHVARGGYYGPTGFMEFRGPPGVAKIEPQALDADGGEALWEAAEHLTGQAFTPGP